jgi:hypothetical protein
MELAALKVTSITPKWLTFKLLWWVQILNQLVSLDAILYLDGDIEGDCDAIFLIP